MIDAVIFDMDGVLIDAREWHYEALNFALEFHGYSSIPIQEHIRTFDGLPTKVKLEMLSKREMFNLADKEIVEATKQARTNELILEKCRPVIEHKHCLTYLKQNKILLGLASNSIRNTINEMLKLSELDQFFDVRISAEDVIEGKPSPEIYNLAMQKLGVKPSSTLIVEDSPHGVEAAVLSGAHVLRVSGIHEVNELTLSQCLTEINHGYNPNWSFKIDAGKLR